MASVLFLSLLLCGASALRQQPESLYVEELSANTDSQGCVEPAHFLTDDLPEATMTLERREGLQTDASADAKFEQYAQNLSFVRKCDTIKDFVDFLGVLVVPRLKLAFCYVPKVACSQFKDLMNNLNELPRSLEGFGHDYLASVRWKMHVRKEDITKKNGWTFATFLRDPALRYLSAFGSTCVAKDTLGRFEHRFECCGPVIQNNRISKAEFVKYFHARLHSDELHGVVAGDDHWVAQTQILRQCGWNWFKPDNIDFVGYLSGDVNAQVKSMLERVNHTDDRLVDRLFPKEHIAGHRSPIHHPAEDFYTDKWALDAVKKLYFDDYYNFPQVGCTFTDKMEKKLAEKAQAQAEFAKPEPPRPKRHPARVKQVAQPLTAKPLFPVVENPFFPTAQPKEKA